MSDEFIAAVILTWLNPEPSFELGVVVATPGALDLLKSKDLNSAEFIRLHHTGMWGDLCDEDWEQNRLAVETGEGRIMSVYVVDEATDERLWIITESDRSATTLLLPIEY